MRIAIGTAQFGMDYGIANTAGRVPQPEVQKILDLARKNRIDTIDTAALYGHSEAVLGAVGVSDFKIVTKVPPLPADIKAPVEWLHSVIHSSLHSLRVNYLDIVLFHRASDIIGNAGEALLDAISTAQKLGRIGKVGLSIYSPQELDQVITKFLPECVQAPINVFDRRMISSGWLGHLRREGVEVHARSLFLQGLLLMEASERPEYFNRWRKDFEAYDDWVQGSGLHPVQANTAYLSKIEEIERVVVGVDSAEQLREVVAGVSSGVRLPPPPMLTQDEALLDPSRWVH